MINEVRELQFQQRGDERGHLVVAESMREIPFEIKRIFYMYGTDNSSIRGKHANRKSEFVMINLCGSCKVKVDDGMGSTKEFCLDKPHTGLYLPKMMWKDMYEFSPDSILLVLCNEYYDASEYIRDYDEYMKEMSK